MDERKEVMATASNSQQQQPSDSENRSEGDGEGLPEGVFECNICLDTAKDAVVSLCGHLFW